MKDIFLKLIFNVLKNYMTFTMIYHFYLKEWKLKKVEKFTLKQALNHELVLKKVHRIIKFNQKTYKIKNHTLI